MKQPILVDSNILVYAVNGSSPKHKQAQKFLLNHQSRLVLAHQNILEFLRVLTHSKFSRPMTPSQARDAITAISDNCQIISPNRTSYYLALLLINKHGLSGDKIFDAYLAATALSNDVSVIATDNTKDFKNFENLKLINPFI